MTQKTIPELIFDKFLEQLSKDNLFKGISKQLFSIIKQEKCSKTEIEYLLNKVENEDSGA